MSIGDWWNQLSNRDITIDWNGPPPPNMSLNSDGHFSTPIRFDLANTGPFEIWNPFVTRASDNVIEALAKLGITNDEPNDPPRAKVPGSGIEAYNGVLNPQTLDYLNADLAKYYGMSRETAYQEALSNTAYQRSVKDMQAAGLNPAVLFGSGRASGADGVGMVRSAASGGSGGYRRGSSSAKSEMSNGQLFSPGMYGVLSAIGGLAGIAATKKPDGFWIGSAVAQGAMQLMNSSTKK